MKNTKYLFFIIAMILISGNLFAQLPNTQIYLLDYRQISSDSFVFSNAKWMTADNPNAYNNQASFFSEKLYYTCQFPDEEGTDIYAKDLMSPYVSRITKTIESEYSPTPLPSGTHFSCVVVEQDSVQRLWKYRKDHIGNGEPVFLDIIDVGYHAWINNSQVALFIVGKPHELIIANVHTKVSQKVTTDIGRCLQKVSDTELAFTQKESTGNFIKILDVNDFSTKKIISTLGDSRDFVVRNDGTFFMALGSMLYKYNPQKDSDWVLIVNLSDFNIENISRLAISKNKLAVVSKRDN